MQIAAKQKYCTGEWGKERINLPDADTREECHQLATDDAR